MGKLEYMEPKEVSDYLIELRSQLPCVSSTKKTQETQSDVSIHQRRQGRKKERKEEKAEECLKECKKQEIEEESNKWGILEDDTSIYEYDYDCLKQHGKSC